MSRVYVVDLAPTAVTVAVDLIEITPADDKPVKILSWHVLQTTELGDAAEEIIGILCVRGHTVSGSGGLTPTPRPVNPSDAAAGFTTETLNTTAANTGTTNNLQRTGWNVRIPSNDVLVPEALPQASQANTTLVLRLAAAPADSVTISGCLVVEELG